MITIDLFCNNIISDILLKKFAADSFLNKNYDSDSYCDITKKATFNDFQDPIE